MLYISRKRSVGAPDGNKNRKSKSYQSDNFETEQKTHEVVAKETGVSPATIMRDAAYAEADQLTQSGLREPRTPR
jgi:hypothetical protein